MGYLALHPERAGRQLCAIVADMVGTEKIDNAHLGIWHDPVSNWSLSGCGVAGSGSGLGKRQRDRSFSGRNGLFSGAVTTLCRPVLGLPTAAMITEPAFSYHSSLDTPDRIEPETSAEKCGHFGEQRRFGWPRRDRRKQVNWQIGFWKSRMNGWAAARLPSGKPP